MQNEEAKMMQLKVSNWNIFITKTISTYDANKPEFSPS